MATCHLDCTRQADNPYLNYNVQARYERGQYYNFKFSAQSNLLCFLMKEMFSVPFPLTGSMKLEVGTKKEKKFEVSSLHNCSKWIDNCRFHTTSGNMHNKNEKQKEKNRSESLPESSFFRLHSKLRKQKSCFARKRGCSGYLRWMPNLITGSF